MTLVKALWSLIHLLQGLSVRMEKATASSNAVEIRLQELRSITVTRGREWLQGALEGISVLEQTLHHEMRARTCKTST